MRQRLKDLNYLQRLETQLLYFPFSETGGQAIQKESIGDVLDFHGRGRCIATKYQIKRKNKRRGCT